MSSKQDPTKKSSGHSKFTGHPSGGHDQGQDNFIFIMLMEVLLIGVGNRSLNVYYLLITWFKWRSTFRPGNPIGRSPTGPRVQ